MSKEYHQIITELDDSNFKPIPYKVYCEKEAECESECEECEIGMQCRRKCDIGHCTNSKRCETSYYFCDESHAQIVKNLQSLLDIPEGVQMSITDYAWTKEVEDAFWNHPLHRGYVNEMTNKNPKFHTALNILKLDIEPCLLEDE